jgi:hypothetical protein
LRVCTITRPSSDLRMHGIYAGTNEIAKDVDGPSHQRVCAAGRIRESAT